MSFNAAFFMTSLRTAVWLQMTIAVSLILYIYIGTDGNIWAAQAVDAARGAGFLINLFSFFIILAVRRDWLLGLNFLFLLAMLACCVLGVLSAFPGTSDRAGNNWADFSSEIGLINYFVILSLALPKQRVIAGLAIVCMVPVVTLALHALLTHPLGDIFNETRDPSICFYRLENLEPSEAKLERIHTLSDLKLGAFIGEHSPRLARVKGADVSLWLFGSRKFSSALRGSGLSPELLSDLARQCETGSLSP